MKTILVLTVFFVFAVAREFDPQNHNNWNLLPHNICGQVDSSRIIGGVEAPMNGYPWIARIGYISSDTHEISFRCGGVIANLKTILTAAHCVTNLPNEFKVSVVRLGEHNTETNPDCVGDFCADLVQDIQPSEIIIPKNYDNPSYKHDIALLKLKKEIKFSDFVKPICFVSGELFKKNLVGSTAEVAGWGIYNIDDPKSSIKLQVVKLPIVKNEVCIKRLPNYVTIGSTQLCVGGVVGKDSCGGDSGGPLMQVDDGPSGPRYFLLGIVSFGSKKCGKSNMPGVYTKMASYMEWFLNNLVKINKDSVKVL